jgi:hypothetical protein
MYGQACSNDNVTVNAWREKWISNAKATKERFGSFKEHGLGQLFGSNKYKPCIVVGSGPSLSNNIEALKTVTDIPIVSCLHNYHYMEDHGIKVDYYVSLDAGDVVVEKFLKEVRNRMKSIWNPQKTKPLLPLLAQARSFLKPGVERFCSLIVRFQTTSTLKRQAPWKSFIHLFQPAATFWGRPLILPKRFWDLAKSRFLGADFCFSYTRKFHAWDSKYDGKLGEAIRAVDVWGNSVLTWQSYYNFKTWFDWLCTNVPGIYINCTEGGLLGSYPEGNIAQIRQMRA